MLTFMMKLKPCSVAKNAKHVPLAEIKYNRNYSEIVRHPDSPRLLDTQYRTNTKCSIAQVRYERPGTFFLSHNTHRPYLSL